MSKYYILAETNRGQWAIYVNSYDNWYYLFTARRIDHTCMEKIFCMPLFQMWVYHILIMNLPR